MSSSNVWYIVVHYKGLACQVQQRGNFEQRRTITSPFLPDGYYLAAGSYEMHVIVNIISVSICRCNKKKSVVL